MAKRAPLPIKTHTNIAAALNSGCNTGTRYFATPVEAPLKLICINGKPEPSAVRRASPQMDLTHIYRAKAGQFQFVEGSARELVWRTLRKARKGLTIAALRAQLPGIADVRAALQVLVQRQQAEEVV